MILKEQVIYPLDWAIFIATLLGTLAIAIYHALRGGRKNTVSEYFVGNRKLNAIPVTVSIVASLFSTIVILGFPAETYMHGLTYCLLPIASLIAALLAATIFVPIFHQLKLTSINEYLYKRYESRLVATLGTFASVMDMLIYASIVYFACATAMEAIAGIPAWISIVAGSSFTVLYTCIGGIRTVIWTDVLQALLMLIGVLTIACQAVYSVGSFDKILEVCEKWDRIGSLNLSLDPTIRLTVWSVVIGFSFSELNRYGTDQASVQRFCSISSLTKARLSVVGLVPMIAVIVLLSFLSGLGMFAYYAELGCDPLRGKLIRNPNQLVPFFLKDTLDYPGVQGVLLASITAASLSTASSALNSSAANIWKDIVHVLWPQLTEKRNVIITKTCVVLLGVLSTVLAFMFMELGGTLLQMGISFKAAFGGPVTAMFLLGMFVPSTNWIGTVAGNLTGFTFCLWLGFGSYSIGAQKGFLPSTVEYCLSNSTEYLVGSNSTEYLVGSTATEGTFMSTTGASDFISTSEPERSIFYNFYRVSYLWNNCFSTIVSFVVGLLVSFLTGGMGGRKVRPELLHPWVRRFYVSRSEGVNNRKPFRLENKSNGEQEDLELKSNFLNDQENLNSE